MLCSLSGDVTDIYCYGILYYDKTTRCTTWFSMGHQLISAHDENHPHIKQVTVCKYIFESIHLIRINPILPKLFLDLLYP